MRISEQEQQETDFDWFCLDLDGEIGHFTTAGFKRLPRSVEESKENLKMLSDYFQNAVLRQRGYTVDPDLGAAIPELENRGERYLKDFISMADKGLYSFDIASYVEPDGAYFRVASPTNPLLSSELPTEIRNILEQTVLSLRFRDHPRISYQATLEA